MKTSKGFLLLEAILAILIASIAVTTFSTIIKATHENSFQMERKTDQALARHIMKTNNLKKITIHDHEYQDEKNKY